MDSGSSGGLPSLVVMLVFGSATLMLVAVGRNGAPSSRRGGEGSSSVLLRGRDRPIFNLAWSPDGRRLAISGFGPKVRVWEVRSGSVRTVEAGTEQTRFVMGWTDGGRRLVVGGLDVPIESWPLDQRGLAEGQGVARPDERTAVLRLLAGSTRGRPIRLWKPDDPRAAWLPPEARAANSIAFDPSGRTFASGSSDGTLQVRDAATGRELRTIRDPARGINSVAYSPDGSNLATSGKGRVSVIEVSSGKVVASMGDPSGGSASMAWSPDGLRLAVATWDGSIRIWDVLIGSELAQFRAHQGQVLALDWSPDGKTLASGGYDADVRLWDVSDFARNDAPATPRPIGK